MAERSVEARAKVPEIRKGDTVVVLSGKDVGKRGKVERVIRRDAASSVSRSVYRRPRRSGVSVVVEGLNIGKRHTKPRQRSGGSPGQPPLIDRGGIIDVPMPLPLGRVMVVCNHCDRPTRIGHRVLDNGQRVRTCRHCGEPLEVRSA